MTAVARYRKLRRSDLKPIARAWISLARIDVALRLLSFQQVLDRADRRAPTTVVTQPVEFRRARAYARWIEIAARHHVFHARCLHRSLVLHQWLRGRGLPSALKIGVRKTDDGIAAHAWVELDGEVVNDQPERVEGFVALSGTAVAGSVFPMGRTGAPQWQ